MVGLLTGIAVAGCGSTMHQMDANYGSRVDEQPDQRVVAQLATERWRVSMRAAEPVAGVDCHLALTIVDSQTGLPTTGLNVRYDITEFGARSQMAPMERTIFASRDDHGATHRFTKPGDARVAVTIGRVPNEAVLKFEVPLC